MRRHLLLIAFALAATLATSAPASPASALTVSPVKLERDIAAGASRREAITIINDSEEAQTYTLSAENFIAKGENGEQTYLKEDAPSGLASWIRFEETAVTVEPGRSRDVAFLIAVPANAEPGGHYAAVFAARGGGTTAGSGIGIAEEVGVLLLVKVPGNIRESLEVDSFRVAGPTITNRLPVTFNLRVKNTGSVHEELTGSLVIRNLLGRVVARPPVNPRASVVLPASTRRIESAWTKSNASGGSGFFAKAKEEWMNFGCGRYTATLEASYGSPQTALTDARVVFWVLPWHLMVVAGAILLFLIVAMAAYRALLIRAILRKTRITKT